MYRNFKQMIWLKTGTIYQLSEKNTRPSPALKTMPFFVEPEKRKICMLVELEYDRQESTGLISPHTPPWSSFILWCLVCFKIYACILFVFVYFYGVLWRRLKTTWHKYRTVYFYLFSDIYHGIVSEFWQFSEKFWIEVVFQKNTEQKILTSTEQQNGGKNI